MQEYSREFSHWNGVKSLGKWLEEEGVPGIHGIDTRSLTKVLREKGSLLGKIVSDDEESTNTPFQDPANENLVAKVSCNEIRGYVRGNRKVVLVDCGTKLNIVRELISLGVHLIRVPWDYDFNQLDYDGVVISNWSGSKALRYYRHTRARGYEQEKPIFGICMGNQILAKAAGASIYKLKYGHRGHSQ